MAYTGRLANRAAAATPGGVWRATFDRRSVEVKGSPRATETLFYEQVAPRLRVAGVPTPSLLWSARVEDSYWLVLEDVPTAFPFPNASAPADDRVLARLHAATREWPSDFPPARGGA